MNLYKPDQLLATVKPLGFTPEWFLDCGVGIGGEAFAAKRMWPKCRIIGLEPAPAAFNAMKDDYPGKLLPVAGWLRQTELDLFAPDTLLYGNLVNMPRSSNPLRTKTTTLDLLDAEHGPFREAYLWMDVEFAEIGLLWGAQRLLERGAIRAVNFENHSVEECPTKSLTVSEILSSFGMTLRLKHQNEGGKHWDELWVKETL